MCYINIILCKFVLVRLLDNKEGYDRMALVSKIDNNFNIKIPDEIIKKAELKPGSDIIWIYCEETKQIILMEKPISFAKTLRG